ncbi:MAG TPA: LysM peptidoglycan-binding domain-containing M23 family metallopeptidase, partial [Anaerolineales bacterium]|nr:LysM peptidoglycan-binding domain-containing M23 family metallopeptidase [Anaerolineales bacterium]
VLVTQRVGLGESLQSISRRLGVSVETLARLNHLTSPAELYAGATLVVPQKESGAAATRRASLAPGLSPLELAVLENTNPWTIVLANDLAGQEAIIPGVVYHLPAEAAQTADDTAPSALPAAIQKIRLTPERIVQGQAVEILVEGQPGMQLHGALAGREFDFYEDGPAETPGLTRYVALQGIHALLDPGLYPVNLHGTVADGTELAFSQTVFIVGGGYPLDPVLIVSPETIDPSVTQPEDAQWMALSTPKTPARLWQGQFVSPAPEPYSDCHPSYYGSRRSYNGSPYSYFHTGLDYCGGVGTQILAPAAGTVVFAGPLTVRGNATMIDHGWGVYSAYMHQSEIKVEVGDQVSPGQVIGLVGGTGRVTGPHLHFEIFVRGVQVDPEVWLAGVYP